MIDATAHKTKLSVTERWISINTFSDAQIFRIPDFNQERGKLALQLVLRPDV
jgi:hypothetical protein